MKLLNESLSLRWMAGLLASLLLEWSALSRVEGMIVTGTMFEGTPVYIWGFVIPKIVFWFLAGFVFVLLVDRNPSRIWLATSTAVIGGYYLVTDFVIRSWHAVTFEGFVLLVTPYVLALVAYAFSVLIARRLLPSRTSMGR